MKQVTIQEGLMELAKAVCKQWIYDGKPESCKPQVLAYAEIVKLMHGDHMKQWYKQAKMINKKKGGKNDWV